MSSKRQKFVPRHVIGGVALTNGVLLHAPDAAVLVVRQDSGELLIKNWELSPEKNPHPFFQLFFIRGLWLLARTIIWNSRVRSFVDRAAKSEKASRSSRRPFQPHHIPTSLFPTIGLFAAFLVYAEVILLIAIITNFHTGDVLAAQNNIVTFLLALLLLLYAVWHGGVWQYMGYHGAEHQAIHAFEDKLSNVEALRHAWPYQNRCGAAVVSYVAILLACTGYIWPTVSFGQSVALAIALFGVSYEIVHFLDIHDHTWWARILILPGVLLQLLVARHPSVHESEVAARALFELKHASRALKLHGEPREVSLT